MTKLEIQAIQRLPKRYIRDGLHVVSWSGNTKVVAAHASLPVICYYPDRRKWRSIKVKPAKGEI